MIVTRIMSEGKQYDVFIDEVYAFSLYKGELKRFALEEDKAISKSEFDEIIETVILKRAKKRVLYLLEKSWKSESEVREKLKKSKYPENVVETAIEYAKSFGYIDDLEYAKRFIDSKRALKSKKEIQYLLTQKRLHRSIVGRVCEEMFDEESEVEAIRTVIRKKNIDLDTVTYDERMKLCQYLLRKGFEYGKVRQVVKTGE